MLQKCNKQFPLIVNKIKNTKYTKKTATNRFNYSWSVAHTIAVYMSYFVRVFSYRFNFHRNAAYWFLRSSFKQTTTIKKNLFFYIKMRFFTVFSCHLQYYSFLIHRSSVLIVPSPLLLRCHRRRPIHSGWPFKMYVLIRLTLTSYVVNECSSLRPASSLAPIDSAV